MASNKDTIEDIKGVFEQCQDAWSEHHNRYIEKYRFNRIPGHQWPDRVRRDREAAGRPCLEINKVNPVIKQIVNDCRQNKPSIKVRPADDVADPDTAEIYSGLIRNIEQTSNADAAYDTSVDCAASGGFGFFRVKLDYAHDDAFDLDILIDRIANPLSVFGDPMSTAVDSSDWDNAFITDIYSEEAFKARWPDAEPVSWNGERHKSPSGDATESIMVAEYWCREEKPKTIVKLSDGKVMDEAIYAVQKDMFDALGVAVVGSREARGKCVYQKLMTGAEILEDGKWPGIWIPIIPVYGDELNDEGERIFMSATDYAQDAQRRYNYWTTTSTELVALAPRVPYIGPEQAFQGEDAAKWATANTENHAYLAFKGQLAPQRQPIDSGPAAGAMQEALVAADEIKATTGVYDASLGARSNETSGRAINARKVEGDTATYHFTDNLARSIRHCGRILIDLIPRVYTQDRMIRVLGEDGQAQAVRLGQPQPTSEQAPGQRKTFDGVYDLSAGKYDLMVDTGPSYTTRRVETREEIMALIQAAPPVAERIADILAKNMDWKDADLIAERLAPPDAAQIPPEVQMQMQQMQEALEECQKLLEQEKSANLKGAGEAKKAEVESRKLDIERARIPIDADQARREVLVAEKELVLANAQIASTQASTDTAVATGDAMQAIVSAATALTVAADRISGVRPVRKRTTIQKVNGQWVGDSVEVPADQGVM